jgi:hypothetical protein
MMRNHFISRSNAGGQESQVQCGVSGADRSYVTIRKPEKSF